MSDNIQKSELVIARFLHQLADLGIQECDVKFKDLKLDKEYEPFFFPCIEWLEAEGVVRVRSYDRYIGGIAEGFVNRPVLTSFGLAALGSTMKIGDMNTKLSEAVKEVSAGNETFANAGNFTGGLLASFIKGLG